MGESKKDVAEQRDTDAATQARAEAVARVLAASRERPEQETPGVRSSRILDHAREFLAKR